MMEDNVFWRIVADEMCVFGRKTDDIIVRDKFSGDVSVVLYVFTRQLHGWEREIAIKQS